MIVHIAISVLLGASAVLSEGLKCSDVRMNLKKAQKLQLEGYKVQELTNFENEVDIVRKTEIKPTTTRHAFSVQTPEESLPGVTLEGTPYKINALEINILNATAGTAVLAVTFLADGNDESEGKVILVVPLLPVAKNDTHVNEALNSLIHSLGTTPEQGIHKNTFAWLQQLLTNVSVMKPTSAHVTAFLTDCQNIVVDHHLIPAF